MQVKGVLFDLDGTLLDTESLYDMIEQQMVNEYGNGQKISWEVRQTLLGTAPLDNSKKLIDKYQIKLSPKEFLKIRDKLLVKPFSQSQFKKGAREITHKFKHELGFKCAIATGSSTQNFQNKTNHLKDWLNEDIDVVVTSDDKRIKEGKPAPDIFILAAKELGLEPNECIVFEDAANGVEAGCRAGVKIVVAVMEKWQRDTLNGIIYDKNRTKLIVLDSLDQFDFSLVK